MIRILGRSFKKFKMEVVKVERGVKIVLVSARDSLIGAFPSRRSPVIVDHRCILVAAAFAATYTFEKTS